MDAVTVEMFGPLFFFVISQKMNVVVEHLNEFVLESTLVKWYIHFYSGVIFILLLYSKSKYLFVERECAKNCE